jgi:hypothetical protein
MITIPISTPRPTSPAVSRKSLLPPAAGAADALVATVGLATATADRVGDGAALVAVGAAVVGAAVGDAVREAVGLGDTGGAVVVAGDGLGLATTLGAGDGDVVLVPSDAQARESATPGADPHTDRAGVTHELPSAAVRASATRMNG